MSEITLMETAQAIASLAILYLPLVAGYIYISRNYGRFFYGINGGLEECITRTGLENGEQ